MRALILALALTGTTASAQDGAAGIAFTFGLGAESQPDYFGADTVSTGATATFDLDYFRIGSLSFGGDDDAGLGLTGSFRLVPSRSAEDFAELTGLDDIDAALEIGGGVSYTAPGAEAFAVVRQGIGGHEGIVGEVGGDLIFYPTNAITLRAGPRLLAGDDIYTGTYFGVSAAEAAASSFGAYAPGGGVVSRGVEISADYALTPDWGLTGTIRYDELLGDAARSPIVQSTDQVTASIVVTRDFSFDF